ncbi:MAG: c-type cytochrome [Deltaproteobacteria bacterium]
MTKWAAALLCCAVVVALAPMVFSLRVGGQQETSAAPAAGSGATANALAASANALAASASALAVTANTLAGMSYAQRYAVQCAACHGANGRIETPLLPLTPVLAGQPSLYVITQLFLFREGRRSNEAMTAVAKTLTDDDLQGFSDFIGTLSPVPPPPPATPPDPIRMARGQALAEQHKCVLCHGAGLGGGQQVPLIGGQREDYLQVSLRGFHSGSRPGYTQAMTAAMSQIPPEDLDPLAYYVARFRDPAEPLTGK